MRTTQARRSRKKARRYLQSVCCSKSVPSAFICGAPLLGHAHQPLIRNSAVPIELQAAARPSVVQAPRSAPEGSNAECSADAIGSSLAGQLRKCTARAGKSYFVIVNGFVGRRILPPRLEQSSVREPQSEGRFAFAAPLFTRLGLNTLLLPSQGLPQPTQSHHITREMEPSVEIADHLHSRS